MLRTAQLHVTGMTVDLYALHRPQRASASRPPASVTARRWIVVALGCAVMAISGVGLAGYLDLSPTAASAADMPAADAAPPG